MNNPDSVSVLLYVLGAIGAVFVTFWLAWVGRNHKTNVNDPTDDRLMNSEVYQVSDGRIVRANFPARRQLERASGPSDELVKLRQLLSSRFPDLDQLLASPDSVGELMRESHDKCHQIRRQIAGQEFRLVIESRQTETPGDNDIHRLISENDELELLRANTEVAPFLLWRQDKSGDITWANRTYLNAARTAFGPDRAMQWPLPALFPTLDANGANHVSPLIRIQTSVASSKETNWYDCHMSAVGDDVLVTAFQADEAVRSEARRREFTQTLTKTFADLAIGLAIFDRSRRLALFNPALQDLTTLSAEFLISRPSLVGFLDQLREKRVMPEPRDYRAWRASIADLESASMNGTYSETWSLPNGQTYRVSGRPHPDGAMALLFEDISAEMSLTRRFRAQIEQYYDTFDALDDAVAIFARNSELVFSNTAYKELWRDDSEATVLGTTVTEATRRWHEFAAPTPVWGDFRDFVLQGEDRSEWSAFVMLRDGRALSCRFIPQKGGASLAIFRPQTASQGISGELRKAV